MQKERKTVKHRDFQIKNLLGTQNHHAIYNRRKENHSRPNEGAHRKAHSNGRYRETEERKQELRHVFTYFFPKLINPRNAATINRDPDPTKTVQFLHMKKAGRDSLRNKMLKNKQN